MSWLLLGAALAAPPEDLDALVAFARSRDPEIAAFEARARASEVRADAAGRLPDPQLMAGVEALGANAMSGEELMLMVGASQMIPAPGQLRAARDRAAVDAIRARTAEDAVTADLRADLWGSAARLEALRDEAALLDGQLANARALLDIGLRRYGAGVGASGGAVAVTSGQDPGAQTAPPDVPRVAGATAGGMAGMGAPAPGGMAPMGAAAPASMGMGGEEMAAGGGAMGGMAAASGLPSLLVLDAGIARLEAERAAIAARLAGEHERLVLWVGAEGADAVGAAPERFQGAAPARDDGAAPLGEGPSSPELRLADTERAVAAADLAVSSATARPDFMVSTGQKVMANGMYAGTDVSVGVRVPLWGARGRAVEGARHEVEAADASRELVARDLGLAATAARAAWEAETARAEALDVAAVRAAQAWEVTVALYAAGRVGADEAVRAWESTLAVRREAIAARRERSLRASEWARLEGR